jgi:2-oxo-4-hydroxy-4-carboxy-5-ureidoimidazoline decarboxylase
VVKVISASGEHYYVGRTGDSSSPHASSLFARLAAHLDQKPHAKGNSLSERVREKELDCSKCEYEVTGIGPLFDEQQNMEQHRPVRDQMAALEKHVADLLKSRGYPVLGTHPRAKEVGAALLNRVLPVVDQHFPMRLEGRGAERLNSLPREEAEGELLKCCGSTRWAREVASRGPFESEDELLKVADEVWWGLGAPDWLEAFSRHPKIGERKAAVGQTQRERAWSADEQSGMNEADEAAREELARLNKVYAEKFGYIFIVCAAGRRPAEMLALLRARLTNDAETEIRVAAEEQRRITRLRLQKLLDV